MPPAAAQVPPLEDENLLWEILLRLPPLPSSLPRASLVSKHWHGIVSDTGFFSSFRRHHGKAPLLGFFLFNGRGVDFLPTLDPPDRIPATRFKLPPESHGRESWLFRGCRNGLCLFFNFDRSEAIVCDPITRHQRRIAFPPEFSRYSEKDGALVQNGGVLCVAGHGHVHGDCHLSPFKLVLLYNNRRASSVSACLYESESGAWGNIVSQTIPGELDFVTPSVLVGNSLCWMCRGDIILEFDMGNQSLGVMEKPEDHENTPWSRCQLLRTQENGLGLVVLAGPIIEIWAKMFNSRGTAELVIEKTIQLHELFPMELSTDIAEIQYIQGFDEETNAIFLSLGTRVFMVNLEASLVRNICARHPDDAGLSHTYCPYRNFYAPGKCKDDQCQAAATDEPPLQNGPRPSRTRKSNPRVSGPDWVK